MLRCLFLSGNVLVLRNLEPGTVMLNRDGIKNRIQYGFHFLWLFLYGLTALKATFL